MATMSSSSAAAGPNLNLPLPEDLIMEILSRLPVKSLLRFRTVCKQFKSLISNPQFINSHLRCSTAAASKNPSIIVTTWNYGTFLVSPIYRHSLENPVYFYLPVTPFGKVDIIGSSDGIICLYGGSVISLWNPFTKHLKHLNSLWENSTIDRNSLGFGFDSISKDYKVVRIVYGSDNRVQVYLYSANSDSWREIQIQENLISLEQCYQERGRSRGMIVPSSQIAGRRGFSGSLGLEFTTCVPNLKGVMYWMSLDRMGLVSFVLHDEVFGTIPFPSCLQPSYAPTIPDIVIFRDSIALISYSYDDETISFPRTSLWTMDDGVGNGNGNGNGCWTKMFTFEAELEIERVYSYLSIGQFLAKKVGGGLFLYDDENKVTKNVQLPARSRADKVFNYTESLVSIKGSVKVQ